MIESEYEVYDFANARQLPAAVNMALQPWLDNFPKLFATRWLDFSSSPLEISDAPTNAATFVELQAGWNAPGVALPVTLGNDPISGMLFVQRTDLLRLLMTILADDASEPMEDRELTFVETSLAQLLLEQVALTVGESWADKDPLAIDCLALDQNPGCSRLFAPDQEMLILSWNAKVASGSSSFKLVLPKAEIHQLLNIAEESPPPVTDGKKISVDSLSKVDVTVSATLGNAMIDMADLLTISKGDIVTLNQSIDTAIVLTVNDQAVFNAWPGKVGETQCLKIDSYVA